MRSGIFSNEIFAGPPNNNYAINKTKAYHINGTCSMDSLDLNDNVQAIVKAIEIFSSNR